MPDWAAISQRPHTVYATFDDQDRVLYVGCTNNLTQRLDNHRVTQWWWGQVMRTEALAETPDLTSGRTEETRQIQEMRPRWNRARAHPRSAWTLDQYLDAVLDGMFIRPDLGMHEPSQWHYSLLIEARQRFGVDAVLLPAGLDELFRIVSRGESVIAWGRRHNPTTVSTEAAA